MACYISSRQNRFYAAVESAFGQAAAVTTAEQFNAVSLQARQVQEVPRRKDKNGSRTYRGVVGAVRKQSTFDVTTYLYERASGGDAPRYGALVQAGLGAPPRGFGGLTVSQINGPQLSFGQAHGLQAGDALTMGSEIRFVSGVPDSQTVVLNAPLTAGQAAGHATGAAMTYAPAAEIPSASLYDYWSPADAVQRLLRGSVVDVLQFEVNGDFHQLKFSGYAADIVDNKSFESGQGGLSAFPAEPSTSELVENPVPGNLGQAWIGVEPSRLFTLSEARIRVKNNVDFRVTDFGSLLPRCIIPGDREVTVDLVMYSQDHAPFDEIYQAARSRTAIPLMIQMGEAAGQMCGIYLPSFIPVVPEFNSSDTRLRWKLSGSQALGTEEDEIYVAFG